MSNQFRRTHLLLQSNIRGVEIVIPAPLLITHYSSLITGSLPLPVLYLFSFPKGIAAKKILTQVGNRIVQGLARVARAKAEFTRSLRTV